jgi:hypothetical protein
MQGGTPEADYPRRSLLRVTDFEKERTRTVTAYACAFNLTAAASSMQFMLLNIQEE